MDAGTTFMIQNPNPNERKPVCAELIQERLGLGFCAGGCCINVLAAQGLFRADMGGSRTRVSIGEGGCYHMS